MKSLAGSFAAGPVTLVSWRGETCFRFSDGNHLPASAVTSAVLITDENKTSVLGAAGGAAIGAILAGPVGAIIGGVLNGRSKSHLVQLTSDDGRMQFIEANREELPQVLSLPAKRTAFTNDDEDFLSHLEHETRIQVDEFASSSATKFARSERTAMSGMAGMVASAVVVFLFSIVVLASVAMSSR